MRSLLLILLLSSWIQALDLTVDDTFAMTEDTTLVFSYAQLRAKCTVSEEPDRFEIAFIASEGDIYLGTSNSGPWTLAVVGNSILSTSYVRFVPDLNVDGSTPMMLVQAGLGGALSPARSVDAIIASVSDPITASSATDASLIEDTPKTYTYADLTTLLHINDPDGDAYNIVLTDILSGSADIAVNDAISSGGSITWTPTADLFTKDSEPDIAALRFRAVNTLVTGQTAKVILSVRIAGVPEDPSGLPTTLTSFDPVRVVRGSMVEYTYDEFHAKCQGLVDPDRTASLYVAFDVSPGEGASMQLIDTDDSVIALDLSAANIPTGLTFTDGQRMRFVIPASSPLGTRDVGWVDAHAANTTGGSGLVNLLFNTQDATGTTDSSSGSSGSCGSGLAGILIVIGLAFCCLKRVDDDA